jgi:hypothetical protein
MSIYEQLNDFDSDKNEMGVSPFSYVALNCAR